MATPKRGAFRIVPTDAYKRLAMGESIELVVMLDDSAIESKLERLMAKQNLTYDDNLLQVIRNRLLKRLKRMTISALPFGQIQVTNEYDALPLIALRIESELALAVLTIAPSVLWTYQDPRRIASPGGH